VDLRQAVPQLQTLLRAHLRPGIALRFDVAEDLGMLRVAPAQLEHVLVNLVANARDATATDGEVVIRALDVQLEAQERAGRWVGVGSYVHLSVTDSGCGMSDEVASHALEPFFTTKPIGQGTGLGLALVHGIVTQNGGFIELESEPGRGTTFHLYLPRTAEEGDRPRFAPTP
jgi:signal transduction histidine kinase